MAISIKAARVNAGYTQEKASAALNVDKSTIINWEKGRTSPSVVAFNKMCELYKVKPEDVFLPPKST